MSIEPVTIRANFIYADDGSIPSALDGYEMHMFFADRGDCLTADYETAADAVKAISAEYLGVDVDGIGVMLSVFGDPAPRWVDFTLDASA